MDCFTTDHFLMCARDSVKEELGRALTAATRAVDAWWMKDGRKRDSSKAHLQQMAQLFLT